MAHCGAPHPQTTSTSLAKRTKKKRGLFGFGGTQKKTCGFGATFGFGGDIPLFCGFGGDFFDALLVVTKNHPHVVVTSTNRATFGGDKALSAQISLFFSGMVVTSAGFGGDKAPSDQNYTIFPGMGVTSAGFGGEDHSALGPLRPAFVAKAAGGWRELSGSRSANSSLPGTLNGDKSMYCSLKVDHLILCAV